MIDPPGLAFEPFDALGRYDPTDALGRTIDPRACSGVGEQELSFTDHADPS
ncbi:MAG: hypothetical protein U0168_14275 [Nannocystaceae bacterium]